MKKNKVGGVISEIEPMRMYDYEVVCGSSSRSQTTNYPEEFIIDKTRLGFLKDQGSVGACVACVMSSLAETFDFIEDIEDRVFTEEELELFKLNHIGEEFSEGWAYGALRDEGMRDWGMIPTNALKNWSKKGMIKKNLFNVLLEAPEIVDMVANFPDLYKKAEAYKIQGYASINYANKEKRDLAIKEALTKNNYGILAVSNNYFQEPHCIMIVGWNDKKNSYKIKNSWGKYWGDKTYGVGEIPKDAINAVYVVFDTEITPPFKDIKKEDWFYKEVKNTYFAGLMNGVSDTEFAPLSYTTRAEMTTILERIINLTLERIEMSLKAAVLKRKTIDIEKIMGQIKNTTNKELPFVDVPSDAWYYSSVKCCYDFELVKGKSETTFKPDSYITRAEIATLCVRICDFIITTLKTVLKACNQLQSSQEQELNEVINKESPKYLDLKSTDWYLDNVIKVYQFGIMSGVANNLFEPERYANRAEVATIVNRLTKFLDTKNNILTKIF